MTTQQLYPQISPQVSVDLEVEGFQVGAFTVPFGTQSQPHRVHQTPLCVFKQSEGPVVCLISGVQPGDVTGTTVLQNLVKTTKVENVTGTLIVCPAFNPVHSENQWSVDERNAISDAFREQVLDTADIIIEIGSGSSSTVTTPCVTIWPTDDKDTNAQAEDLMFSMGAPDSVRRIDSPLPHSLADYSHTSNTTFLKVELGQHNATDKSSRLMGLAQCHNALVHIGILPNEHFNLNSTRILQAGKPEYKITTPVSGLVHWHVELGGNVYRGNPIAHIFDPHNPFAEAVCIDAQMNGVLLTKFSGAYCTPDNLLAEVADELPR